MSIVTDQLSNQNIIELARKNYENQKRTKVPGYSATLPSFGLIYAKSSPLRAGVVELRHMTSYDEDLLANETYINDGTVLQRLIDGLLLTDGINADDLSNPDLEALCISARIFSYGKMYPVQIIDPTTGAVLDREIDLSALKAKEFALQSDDNGEFEYTVESSGDIIKFKYLCIREVKNIDPDHQISGLVTRSVCSINGNSDRNFIDEYIKYTLRAGDSKQFRQYLAKNMYGFDYNIEFEGENKDTFISRFPIGSEVLWV